MADKFDAGLAHLVGQSNKQPGKDFDPTKCMLVMIPLTGREYYAQKFGPSQIGMVFEEAYSEIRDKNGDFLSVKKHEKLVLVGTGFIMEPIAFPPWWGKRDSGGI